MELPNEIAVICENACKSWQHADDVMNQPYAPMHSWPIKQKDDAIKILDSYHLYKYNLPDSNLYPLLCKYMDSNRKRYEIRQIKILEESKPEYQLKKKEQELMNLEDDINHLKYRLDSLSTLYKNKQEEINKLKLSMI
jgi:hypothetical protein